MDEDHVALIDDVHADYVDWMHSILGMMYGAISANSWHSSENLRNYHWNETIDKGSVGGFFFVSNFSSTIKRSYAKITRKKNWLFFRF